MPNLMGKNGRTQAHAVSYHSCILICLEEVKEKHSELILILKGVSATDILQRIKRNIEKCSAENQGFLAKPRPPEVVGESSNLMKSTKIV